MTSYSFLKNFLLFIFIIHCMVLHMSTVFSHLITFPTHPLFPLLLILFVILGNFASVSYQIYMHDFM